MRQVIGPSGPADLMAWVRSAAGLVQIRIVEAAPRSLGLLRLPVLLVSMRFSGLPPAARAEFLRHFDLFTQRGGG